MDDFTWNEVNTLVAMLQSSNIVGLVEDYYNKYDNNAPAESLRQQIEAVQDILNETRHELYDRELVGK